MFDLVDLLAPIGLVQIIRYSTLFGDEIPLREDARQVPFLKNLVDCSLCLGFWAGIACFMAIHHPAAAVCATAVGGMIGTIWGIVHTFSDDSPCSAKIFSYSTMGVMIGAFPLLLIAGCFVGTGLAPMLSEMFLAGLTAAPVCYVADLMITYIENQTKY